MTKGHAVAAINDSNSRASCKKTSFGIDVLKIVTGTAAAQLLNILASPVLTRLYGPEAFGLLAIFTAITSTIGVVACLRYELAIMLPERDEDAANMLGVSLLSALVVTILTVPIIWSGKDLLLNLLNAPELGRFLWLVPPMVFVLGVFLALNYWNSRTKHFGRLSITRVAKSLSILVAQLGYGLTGFANGGAMVSSMVIGNALSTSVLAIQIGRNDAKFLLRTIHMQGIVKGVVRYKKFLLFGTWSALLNTMSWQLPAFMLSSFFSPSISGFYALGFRMLNMPMILVGSSIGQVFFQRASKAKTQGNLPQLVGNVFYRLVMFGMFPMFMLAIVGKSVFIVVFGVEWAEAGLYSQILAIWAFFWFVSSPMSMLFNVLEKQEFGFKFNIFLFTTRIITLATGGYFKSPRLALILYSASGICIYIYLIIALMVSARVRHKTILTILIKGVKYFLPFGLIAAALVLLRAPSVAITLWFAISAFLYASLLWKKEPELFQLRH